MMTKNLFTKGVAVMAMMGVLTACSHDNDVYQPSKEEKMANAQAQLGVDIDPNQSWRMTASATAKVSVNMSYGETYTVQVYSNDPLVEGKGYVLTKIEVQDGQTVEKDFEYPSALRTLVASITDSKGYTSYKSAAIVDSVFSIAFGSQPAAARGVTRSETTPEVPHINIPDDAYAKSFLEGAKEPTDENIVDNYDNSVYVPATPGGNYVPGTSWGWGFNAQSSGGKLYYNSAGIGQSWFNYENYGATKEEFDWFVENVMPYVNKNWAFYGADSENDAVTEMITRMRAAGYGNWVNVWQEGSKGHYEGDGEPTEGHWEYDETFVLKFKITGNYTGGINVLATEENPAQNTKARSVYVSGKWVVNGPYNGNEQRVGGGAVIVVDKDGELEIPEGKQLTFVNEARLVVMPGGKITGAGKILVTNGNAEGLESYNGGTIDIASFNNNFGKFYNYGTFKCTNLEGGAGLSNFYNHGVAHIVRSGKAESWGGNYNTSNTRIYNACQWICDEDMRAYIVEMAQGSYFYVGGELMMSDGTDGTAKNSYVALASGALMQVHSLWNNNSSWTGPTSGYAVVELGQVTYLNWTGQPVTQGYFINNIAVSVDDKTVGTDTYVALRDYVSNGHGATGNVFDPIGKDIVGNNGTVMVEKGKADVTIPASTDFEAGVKGCTPGYNGMPTTDITTQPAVWSYAFEDTPLGDYDMNDVVIKVSQNANNENKIDVTLCCTGASFDLTVWLGETPIFKGLEVHSVLGQPSGSLVNTGKGPWAETVTATIDKPATGFSFADADFWIESKAVPGGVHIAREGEDPHGVVIPEDWAWPVEYICIKDAYPDFVEFAKDASTTDETIKAWYKNPVEDLVVRR